MSNRSTITSILGSDHAKMRNRRGVNASSSRKGGYDKGMVGNAKKRKAVSKVITVKPSGDVYITETTR